jgi:mono/diheme cytochrome c family protein
MMMMGMVMVKALRPGFVALAWVILLGTGPVWAAPAAEPKDQGKALLTRMCGDCHAVGPTGDSSHRGAPPFRTIGTIYNIAELTERMAEQLISIHPDMPDFRFTEREAKAIRAYLYSIQR